MKYLIRLTSPEDCTCKAIIKAESREEALALAAQKLNQSEAELIAIPNPLQAEPDPEEPHRCQVCGCDVWGEQACCVRCENESEMAERHYEEGKGA